MVNFLIDSTFYVPVTFSGTSGVNNTSYNGNPFSSVNPNGQTGSNNGTSTSNANTADVVAPASDDYRSQFQTKLGLIRKYCEDYIVLDENGDEINVNNIYTKYANNLEEGVRYCDTLIKSFDQEKVKTIVKTEYKKRVDGNIENAETIANDWVKTIKESGTDAANINTSNVNAGNILDVTGAFIMHEDSQNGTVSLSQLFENTTTAEILVTALKQKAQSFIKRTDLDADKKETIRTQTNDLVDTKYLYLNSDTEDLMTNRDQLVTKYMTLFETIRTEQARLNDAAAPAYYGLPSDSNVTFTNETDRATAEMNAYRNRRTLNANI